MRHAILALMLLVGLTPEPAAAQASPCAGRVLLTRVYGMAAGEGRHEYFFVMRNMTNRTLRVEVHFSGFPASVTLLSPVSPAQVVQPNAVSPGLRFGHGTSDQVNEQTVAFVYDAPAGVGPTIRLNNCRS